VLPFLTNAFLTIGTNSDSTQFVQKVNSGRPELVGEIGFAVVPNSRTYSTSIKTFVLATRVDGTGNDKGKL
jgi:hypothetical protein